jgi:hypothetical protein
MESPCIINVVNVKTSAVFKVGILQCTTVDLFQISALLFSILYCNFINTWYKLWRNISNIKFNPLVWPYSWWVCIQHILLDFGVDHILTANTIDDGHWFSDESEGIVICMYFINFCGVWCLFVSSCGWLFKCANCSLIFFNFHLNIVCVLF